MKESVPSPNGGAVSEWPSVESIRQQLEKIITSQTFARSARSRRFLRYAVECLINGDGAQIKEYVLGVEGLTHDDADAGEPDFSPDGTKIAFRWERDGGGIYVIPTLGSAEPRLVIKGGRSAKFSPDGMLLAYWSGPGYENRFGEISGAFSGLDELSPFQSEQLHRPRLGERGQSCPVHGAFAGGPVTSTSVGQCGRPWWWIAEGVLCASPEQPRGVLLLT